MILTLHGMKMQDYTEGKCRVQDIFERAVLKQVSEKVCYIFTSDTIKQGDLVQISHIPASYMPFGENVNVMLEYRARLFKTNNIVS